MLLYLFISSIKLALFNLLSVFLFASLMFQAVMLQKRQRSNYFRSYQKLNTTFKCVRTNFRLFGSDQTENRTRINYSGIHYPFVSSIPDFL